MDTILTELLMFIAKLTYKAHKNKNPSHKMIYIQGTGKDYPNCLVYSESELWTKELIKVCESK